MSKNSSGRNLIKRKPIAKMLPFCNDFISKEKFKFVSTKKDTQKQDKNKSKYKKSSTFNNRMQQSLLKSNKKFKLTKPKIALIVIGTIVLAIALSFLINNLLAYYKNKNQGKQENFSTENIIENNNNDLIIDDAGQIIVDPITDEEILHLIENLNIKILQDANKRVPVKIEDIKNIHLISQLPSNDCIGLDENNPENLYDKYMITLLFSDNKNTYQLSYFTGKKFDFDENSIDKNTLSDFIVYLCKECALDSCQILSSNESQLPVESQEQNIQTKILNALGVNGAIGEYYYSYNQIGELQYNIPIYVKSSDEIEVLLYSCLAKYIDNYELDPLQTFYDQLVNNPLPELPAGQESYFEMVNIVKNSNLETLLSIYDEFTEKKEDIETGKE